MLCTSVILLFSSKSELVHYQHPMQFPARKTSLMLVTSNAGFFSRVLNNVPFLEQCCYYQLKLWKNVALLYNTGALICINSCLTNTQIIMS